MKQKNLIVLLIILAALIGLVFVKKATKPEVPTTEESVDVIATAVNAASVNEISLLLVSGKTAGSEGVSEGQANEAQDGQAAGEGDTTQRGFVSLVKEGDKWKDMTQYGVYANETNVASALDMLDQLKGELRSNKANVLGDYGITEEQALNIKLKRTDGQIVHILVGTETAGYQDSFVRLQDSNAVYVVSGNLLATFGVRGEDKERTLDTKIWADKRIAHLNVNDITGISITQTVNGVQEKVIDLQQETLDETKKWQSTIPYDFNLNANKIKNIAENLNNTYAQEVIASGTPGVYDAPGWVGTFTLAGGQAVKIVRGNKDSDSQNYYVKEDGAAYHFLVPVSAFDSRENQQGDIFTANPLKVEEKTVTAIAVADLESKKEFSAVKKSPDQTAEAPAQGEAGTQEANKEDVWTTPSGESMDAAKVRDILSQISAFNLEAVPLPAASLANVMTLSITGEEGAKQYTVSKDIKLDNGKECHFLKAGAGTQGYCVSKSQVTALKNALP